MKRCKFESKPVSVTIKIITSVNINKSWECVDDKKHGFLGYVSLLVALWCCTLICNPVKGQGLCSDSQGAGKGGFTLTSSIVCLGQSVSVTADPGIQSSLARYVYIYSGSTNVSAVAATAVPNTTFQYAVPGSYTILQFASNGATGTIACQVVNVVPTAPIKFSYQICNSASGNSKLLKLIIDTSDPLTKGYDKIDVRWGDSLNWESFPISSINNVTHTYPATSGGIFRVEVKGGFTANSYCIPETNSQNITITPTLTPSLKSHISDLVSSATGIKITVLGTPGQSIELLQKNGTTFQPTGLTATNGNSLTIAATQQTQCFKVRSVNGCGEVDESEEVCSLVLGAQAGNRQNILSWQPYQGAGNFIRYQLKRFVNGSGSLPIATLPAKATGSYTDTDNILCGSQYCYQLEAIVFDRYGNTITVTSAQTCVVGTSTDTPGAMRNLTVSVEGNGQIRVRALAPTTGTTTNFSLIVSRADTPNGPFQQVGVSVNNTIFFDKGANPNNQSYCYQVVYRSECGNDSPPATACTIFLSSGGTGIDWTAASPFTPGSVTEYTLEVYDAETGNHVKDIPMGGNTHYEPDPNDQSAQTFRYRIYAEYGPYSSMSNYYDLKRNAGIFVPSAFTPNGDGINDRFVPLGTFWTDVSMTVFNLWGQVVYREVIDNYNSQTNKLVGWDGNYDGQPAPANTYQYQVTITDKDNQQIVKRGTVLLIR